MKSTVQQAQRRIAPHIRRTQCRFAPALSELVRGQVFLKLENTQISGSFKLRGVINKTLSLSDEESQNLLVTASTGNHAAAFAHAAPFLEVNGDVILAWMHLWRADTALKALNNKAKRKDQLFYKGLLDSARFFIETVLPVTAGKMQSIMAMSAAAVEMDEAGFGN